MKFIIADNSGFCFGVNRAMSMTEKELNKSNTNLVSIGPLIHNPQEVKRLNEKGLFKVDDIKELDRLNNKENTKIIIRSHGTTKEIINTLALKGYDVIDTTCPYVKSIHKKVEDFKNQGYNIVIVGSNIHPEVIGINGWCNNEAYIVNSIEEAKKLPSMNKVCIVCQTTNKLKIFNEVSSIIAKNSTNVEIFNTICNATKVRQESAKELSKKVDAMVVIGGYTSSNTNKLAEVSKEYCDRVYHIETADQLPIAELSQLDLIGVTAGASTPDWIIQEVTNLINNINNEENVK